MSVVDVDEVQFVALDDVATIRHPLTLDHIKNIFEFKIHLMYLIGFHDRVIPPDLQAKKRFFYREISYHSGPADFRQWVSFSDALHADCVTLLGQNMTALWGLGDLWGLPVN